MGTHVIYRRRGDHDRAGRLAARFGYRAIYIVSVVGFTIASMACGFATSLYEVVVFRFIQGIFGAALVPLSQGTMLNIYRPKNAARRRRYGAWG